MLKVNDTIRMVKPIGKVDLTGQIFNVIDIDNEGITLAIGFNRAYMSIDGYEKYFVKVKQWTDWIRIGSIAYKTDNEKYVKLRFGDYSAKASCHPMDTFDIDIGIQVCMDKIARKMKQ